jgi:hypothetical protein
LPPSARCDRDTPRLSPGRVQATWLSAYPHPRLLAACTRTSTHHASAPGGLVSHMAACTLAHWMLSRPRPRPTAPGHRHVLAGHMATCTHPHHVACAQGQRYIMPQTRPCTLHYMDADVDADMRPHLVAMCIGAIRSYRTRAHVLQATYGHMHMPSPRGRVQWDRRSTFIHNHRQHHPPTHQPPSSPPQHNTT